jgi:hypothetical protein
MVALWMRMLLQLSTATDGGYSFVKARAEYRQEVALLRKDFIVEEQRRKEKLARDAECVACSSSYGSRRADGEAHASCV